MDLTRVKSEFIRFVYKIDRIRIKRIVRVTYLYPPRYARHQHATPRSGFGKKVGQCAGGSPITMTSFYVGNG